MNMCTIVVHRPITFLVSSLLLTLALMVSVTSTAQIEDTPYRSEMNLGSLYEKGTDDVTVNIFLADSRFNHKQNSVDEKVSKVALITKQDSLRQLFGVSPEVALKARAGLVDIGPIGSFLRRSRRSGSVEIAVYANCHVSKQVVKNEAIPEEMCASFDLSYIASHYVHTIGFGGSAVASIIIQPIDSTSNDTLVQYLKQQIGMFGKLEDSIDGLKRIERELSARNSIEIQWFDSGNSMDHYSPVTISGMLDSLHDFCTGVREHPDSAAPTRVILYPIRSLPGCTAMPKWTPNSPLIEKVADFDSKFEDIIVARQDMDAWLDDLPSDPDKISNEYLILIAEFGETLKKVEDIFRDTISHLDVSETAPTDQLDKAIDVYLSDSESSNNNLYTVMWMKLTNKIVGGGWCNWSSWSFCECSSQSPMGAGVVDSRHRIRRRRCLCPAPWDAARATCHGEAEQQGRCDAKLCPEPMECTKWRLGKAKEDVDISCRKSGFVTSFNAPHDILKDDKLWSFTCCSTETTERSISKAYTIHKDSHTFSYQCQSGFYISGIKSAFYLVNGYRFWTVTCRKSPSMKLGKPQFMLIYEDEGSVAHEMAEGWLLCGFGSVLNMTLREHIWHIYRCSYENHE